MKGDKNEGEEKKKAPQRIFTVKITAIISTSANHKALISKALETDLTKKKFLLFEKFLERLFEAKKFLDIRIADDFIVIYTLSSPLNLNGNLS